MRVHPCAYGFMGGSGWVGGVLPDPQLQRHLQSRGGTRDGGRAKEGEEGGRERRGEGREKKKGRREGDARYLGMENNSDLCYILTQRIETSDLFPEVLPGEVGWREIATSCGCSASVSS